MSGRKKPSISRTSRAYDSMTPVRLSFLAMALAALASVIVASAAAMPFDIPAQPAPAALKAFIRQSHAEVTYRSADLEQVTANPVKGEFEPAEALETLLKGSGYSATRRASGIFVVSKSSEATGTVDGAVRDESGRPIPDARVALANHELFAVTDRRGRFSLTDVPAGEHVLQVSAEGLQKTRVTDVNVRGGHRSTLSAITIPSRSAGLVQLEDYVVSAKKNDGVIELDPYEVESSRARPFVDGNIDLPRTINDAQPYYVFDARTMETSGAIDVGDFLKQRLTMNTVAQTNSQLLNRGSVRNGAAGTTSNIDLRGVGATLVLVNGRQVAGFSSQGFIGEIVDGQADLNGIPFNAIERIEVLPTSASGIYGGQAIGGVVNVVLKKSYQGGRVSLRYDDVWGGNAPRRTADFNYGGTLEGGRTRYSVSASWSDGKPVRFRSVADWHREYFDRAEANLPNHVQTSATAPYPGALTNVLARLATVTNLTFDDGTPLGSRVTHVPAGIGPDATFAQLKAALLANAGTWNTDLPEGRTENGLESQLEKSFKRQSVHFNLTRQMWTNLEANASFSYNTNDSNEEVPVRTQFSNVPGNSPFNPFREDVYVRIPHNQYYLGTATSDSKSLNLGVIAQLPHEWLGTVDYTWSENRNSAHYTQQELGFAGPIARGELNVFVDPALLEYDVAAGGPFYDNSGRTRVHTWMARAQGPIYSLPWGQPRLVVGGDYKLSQNPTRYSSLLYPLGPSIVHEKFGYVYFPRDSTTISGYGEVTIPLVKQDALPFLHSLEVQAAGRVDRYEVDAGTMLTRFNMLTDPPTRISYFGPVTADGQPIRRTDTYGADSMTLGIKYEPIRDVIVRGSLATAFRPPTPSQLVKNEVISSFPSNVTDPKTGTTASVLTLGGGNPDLKPQTSESLNLGVVWAPRSGWLRDLRLNVEYYRIQQFDSVTSPSAQLVIDQETLWPERVTRDATGRITLVDVSAINLFMRDTDGWDFSASYSRSTRWGTFRGSAVHTLITSLETQYSATRPAYDAIGFHPVEGGAPEHKGNVVLDWEYRGVSASWAFRYFGSYHTPYRAGGPISLQSFNGGLPSGVLQRFAIMNGGDEVESQYSHDLVLGYTFDTNREMVRSAPNWQRLMLSGVSVQLGIRNVFDTPPAFDSYFAYFSPYGENRPRSFWVTVKRHF
jgi:iron complex outermembrane recepter protein